MRSSTKVNASPGCGAAVGKVLVGEPPLGVKVPPVRWACTTMVLLDPSLVTFGLGRSAAPAAAATAGTSTAAAAAADNRRVTFVVMPSPSFGPRRPASDPSEGTEMFRSTGPVYPVRALSIREIRTGDVFGRAPA